MLIKLLIVDDHPRVREALARVLGSPGTNIEVVGVAASGQEAIRAVADGHTHLSPEVAQWLRERGTANGQVPPARLPGSLRTGDSAPGEPGTEAAAWLFPVSERERCLLRLLARGHSPQQIEEELLMSRPTQERYLAQLREKTSTTGIDSLLAWVHEQGLLNASDHQ